MKAANIHTTISRLGHNIGLPGTSIEINDNPGLATQVVADIVDNCNNLALVVVTASSSLKGIGVVMSGLKQIGFTTELHFTPEEGTYNWLKLVAFPVARWTPEAKFNFFTLNKEAFVIFEINTKDEVESIKDTYFMLRYLPCSKYMIVPPELEAAAIELAVEYPRCRIGVTQPEVEYVRAQ